MDAEGTSAFLRVSLAYTGESNGKVGLFFFRIKLEL